jgi:hypothetical protein
MDIKRIIQEEIDSFEWADEVEGIHVGMCLSFKNHHNRFTITQISGDVAWLTSPDTDGWVQYGVRKLKGLIGNGTMTLCQS